MKLKLYENWGLSVNAGCVGMLIGIIVAIPPTDWIMSLFIVIPLGLNLFPIIQKVVTTSNVTDEKEKQK
jgi:hypothetical protein